MTVIIIKSKIFVIKQTKENLKQDINAKKGENKIIRIIIGEALLP
jgi:hypothetical protein